ncbi:MAG: thioredoxin reductase, partial [Gaiellales bacterium]|nr:thioredoxin reductase [Gaiellales bacterium]
MPFATVRPMIEFNDLRGLPLFDGVSDSLLSRVIAHAADVRVDAGQWLVREGESAAFYVLLAGTYDLMKRYPDGIRRIAVRQRGDWLGELPIVFGAPFFAGARAATPIRVARFDRAQFGQLVRNSDEFKARVVAEIQLRVEGLEDEAAGELRLPIVVGRSQDPACHDLRDFLSRNQVRFEWADPDDEWAVARPALQDAIASAADCSVVLLPNGDILTNPSLSEL